MIFTLNGSERIMPTDWGDEPLLHLLREYFGLVGAKFGCGVGQCGACTVIVDDEAVRSCVVPSESIVGSDVRTIEGLADGERMHPVQQAWLDEAVPQCGYCQAGQIMAAVALLGANPNADDTAVEEAMEGLCRCGTYSRIRKAVARAAIEISASEAS